MSNSFCASRPSFSASTKASQTAIIDAPRIMLLQVLAACPLPAAPACTTALPIAEKIGCARANACALPPTMKVSVAACAPATPPETGASSIARPLLSAAPATARAVSTSIVEQSISKVPGTALATTPSSPRYTSRTSWPLGSIVIITSAIAQTRAREPGMLPPAAPKFSTAVSLTSSPLTEWPALSRLRAIGKPMLPRPTKPIRAIAVLVLAHLSLEAAHRHGITDFKRHEIFADFQRAIISLPRLRDQIVDRGRRDLVAAQHDQMRVGRKFRLGLREHLPRLARRCVVGDDALDVGFLHQFRRRSCDFVDQQVGAGAVLDDIGVVTGVAREYRGAAAIFDAVAVGRLDDGAMVDLEGDHLDAVLLVDDTIAVELLDPGRNPLR